MSHTSAHSTRSDVEARSAGRAHRDDRCVTAIMNRRGRGFQGASARAGSLHDRDALVAAAEVLLTDDRPDDLDHLGRRTACPSNRYSASMCLKRIVVPFPTAKEGGYTQIEHHACAIFPMRCRSLDQRGPYPRSNLRVIRSCQQRQRTGSDCKSCAAAPRMSSSVAGLRTTNPRAG